MRRLTEYSLDLHLKYNDTFPIIYIAVIMFTTILVNKCRGLCYGYLIKFGKKERLYRMENLIFPG